MYTRNQKNANERRVVFLSHFKEEASSEARLLKIMLLQEMAEHGVSNDDIFLDSDNLHKITELLQEVKRTDNLVVLLTKRLLTRPWCLLELWAAHQNGVNIVPVKIECRGATRLFEFGPSAEAFKNDLASQVDQTCIEQIVQHGAMVTEIQVAIAELLDSIAVNFNVDASERQQKAQVLDMIDRFRTAQSSEAKEEEKAPAEAAAAEMAAIELREAEQRVAAEQAAREREELREQELKKTKAAAEAAAAAAAAEQAACERRAAEEAERRAAEEAERRRRRAEEQSAVTPEAFHKHCKEGRAAEVAAALEAARGDPTCLRALLEHRDGVDCTPLHYAACYGQGKVVQLLLEAGANRDARNNKGRTPLYFAQNPPKYFNEEQKKGCAAVVGVLS